MQIGSDIESGIIDHSCCWNKHLFRDWSQYILGAGLAAGTAAVGYGYFSREVAPVGVGIAIDVGTILFGCVRIYCLRPLHDLDQNIGKVEKRAQDIDKANRQLSGSIAELSSVKDDLSRQLKSEQERNQELEDKHSQTLKDFKTKTMELNEALKHYAQLEELYNKVKTSLLEASQQINRMAELQKEADRLSGKYEKNNDNLIAAIDNLEDADAKFKKENNTLESLLEKLNKGVRELDAKILRLSQEKDAFKKLADEAKKLDEADDKYLESTLRLETTLKLMEKLNEQFAVKTQEIELFKELLKEVIPLLTDAPPEIIAKIEKILK